ncbi:MAG TPA: hypothetical protein VM869_33385 [Enhygromyxa sp.]|nr:hypothetical protein [Enhygromyxa sp.]
MDRRSKDPALPKRAVARRYHVALTPREVLERLSEFPGVKAYRRATVPDFGGVVADAEYTLELGDDEFTLHCGPPAARGQTATGMLRILYLRGRMTRTDEGTLIELSFAHRRPRWALQRWVGFLALASLGLLWVLIGPGELAKKALLYGILLAVLGPVVVHDLRRAERIEDNRKALLNLVEHSFGPIQLDEPHPDEPYRRRMIASSSVEPPRSDHEPEDDDEDDD